METPHLLYESRDRRVSLTTEDGTTRYYTVWTLAQLGIVTDHDLGVALTNPDTFVSLGGRES